MSTVNPTTDVGTHRTTNLPVNKVKKSHTGLIVGGVILVIILIIAIVGIILLVVYSHRHKTSVPSGTVTITYKATNGTEQTITPSYSASTYSGDMSSLVSDLNTLFSINRTTVTATDNDNTSNQLLTASYNNDKGTVTLTLNSGYDYVYVSSSIMPYFGFDSSFMLFSSAAIANSNVAVTSMIGCPIGELPVSGNSNSNNSS